MCLKICSLSEFCLRLWQISFLCNNPKVIMLNIMSGKSDYEHSQLVGQSSLNFQFQNIKLLFNVTMSYTVFRNLGNHHKISLHPLFLLLLLNKNHTLNLILQHFFFINPNCMNLLIFTQCNFYTLPCNIQKQFFDSEGGYKLRGCRNFKF